MAGARSIQARRAAKPIICAARAFHLRQARHLHPRRRHLRRHLRLAPRRHRPSRRLRPRLLRRPFRHLLRRRRRPRRRRRRASRQLAGHREQELLLGRPRSRGGRSGGLGRTGRDDRARVQAIVRERRGLWVRRRAWHAGSRSCYRKTQINPDRCAFDPAYVLGLRTDPFPPRPSPPPPAPHDPAPYPPTTPTPPRAPPNPPPAPLEPPLPAPPPPSSPPPAGPLDNWLVMEGKNCWWGGHGAEEVGKAGSAVPGVKTALACQRSCVNVAPSCAREWSARWQQKVLPQNGDQPRSMRQRPGIYPLPPHGPNSALAQIPAVPAASSEPLAQRGSVH